MNHGGAPASSWGELYDDDEDSDGGHGDYFDGREPKLLSPPRRKTTTRMSAGASSASATAAASSSSASLARRRGGPTKQRYPKNLASSAEVYSDYDDDIVGSGDDMFGFSGDRQPRSVSFPTHPTTAVVRGDIKLTGGPVASAGKRAPASSYADPSNLRLDSDDSDNDDAVYGDGHRAASWGGRKPASRATAAGVPNEAWYEGDGRDGQDSARRRSSLMSDTEVNQRLAAARQARGPPSIFDSIDSTTSVPPLARRDRAIPPSIFDSVDTTSIAPPPRRQDRQGPSSRHLPSVFDSVNSLGTARTDDDHLHRHRQGEEEDDEEEEDEEGHGDAAAGSKMITVSPMRIEIRRPSATGLEVDVASSLEGKIPVPAAAPPKPPSSALTVDAVPAAAAAAAAPAASVPLSSSWETAVPARPKHQPDAEPPKAWQQAAVDVARAQSPPKHPPAEPNPYGHGAHAALSSSSSPSMAASAPKHAPRHPSPHPATGTSITGRPPRPRPDSQFSALSSSASLSTSAAAGGGGGGATLMRTSYQSSDTDDGDENVPSGGLSESDGLVALQPLSPYAQRTGVIIEGWMDKKSDRTRLWQRRYFVLSESATEFCTLRIFYKAVETTYGTVPFKLKASIPISAIQTVRFNASKIRKGKQFKVVFNRSNKVVGGGGTLTSGYMSAQSSDAGDSDREEEKTMSLKAETVQERLLWVALLEQALKLFTA